MDDPPRWWRTVPLVLANLLAIALALIIYLADRAAEQREQAIASQRHSYEVMMLAEQLDGTIANSEALLGRYVVSLDLNIGRQYQAEWRKAQAELTALVRATRDSPAQTANVEALKTAVNERGATLTDIALRTTYKQRLGAIGRYYEAGKSPTILTMRDALQRTIDHEKDELDKRSELVDRSEKRVSFVNNGYGIVGLGLLAAALLALWFAYGALRERLFARRLADFETERVDGLESAVRQRTEELQEANLQLRNEIEERGRAEQSLLQLQKMEAIGKLTGGIAHDFNNMLAVMVSGIELARRALTRDPVKARRHLNNAMEGAERAAVLTSRLLQFARPDSPAASRVRIDALVEGMGDLIDRATDDGIIVELALAADDWSVWADAAQLENAVLNLVINARDAMGGRGALTIATRQTALHRAIGQCQPGDYVSISVSDTGCGMSQQTMARIFEPFFTTKPVGKGTGLGLSLIFGFVRAAGGEIDVQSVEGEGTTFTILLPRRLGQDQHLPAAGTEPVKVPAADMRDAEDVMPAANGNGHLVMVVEDDPRVLRATMDGLEALGYRGLSCNHPRKAAGLLSRHPETALILSDVLMPDMTGPEMIAALNDLLNGRPIVFVTGYAGESEGVTLMSGVPVLRKPFTQAQLARVIENALKAPPRLGTTAPLH